MKSNYSAIIDLRYWSDWPSFSIRWTCELEA